MKQYRQTLQESMVTTSKAPYTFSQKVFCCRCFDCLKQEVVLTSDVRRKTLQRMVQNFATEYDQSDKVEDSIKLMILIHLSPDESVPERFINRCQINPSQSTSHYRTDLQFYIPQVTNYLVFHNDLKHNYLSEALTKACKLTFYFAHALYFYFLSLEKIVGANQIQTFKKVTDFRQIFLDEMCNFYKGQMLNSVQLFAGEKVRPESLNSDIGTIIKNYGKGDQLPEGLSIGAKDITLPNYSSIFNDKDQPEPYSFKSTLNFFEDLFKTSQELKNFENKNDKIVDFLRQINMKLPACVYVPFAKLNYSYYNVLNIVVEETRIFSTKSRAPFYICLEVYNPIEAFPFPIQQKYTNNMQRPITIRQIFPPQSVMPPPTSRKSDESKLKKPAITTKKRLSNQRDGESQFRSNSYDKNGKYLTDKLQKQKDEMKTQPYLNPNQQQFEMKANKKIQQIKFHEMFGESETQTFERIRKKSIYKFLSTWQLIHLIVKTGDNLKQEQFAMQLISQFDYIFKLEGLPLLLTPYEVVSMGPDCGIIEMVKDSITLDKLKRHIKNAQKSMSLKECFELYFEDVAQAKDTFMRSLAAYSLVMYFLQAKDRHNGNILLHTSGKIFHIDFGFFLSNLPGKGVQLERDCPFKLLSEYIDVLDGYDSYYFKKFRQYLFLGFKAIRHHQNKILLLVKMMYSSSGTSMPCFEKGEEAIRQMELRFNPPNVTNDAQLNLHCQKLINDSLDNWATKWYDRFQYFAQGIFY